MENEPNSLGKSAKEETEIETLARIVNVGFDRMDKRFDAVDARLEGADRRFAADDKRLDVLNQKIDRVDAKLDQHRQETKDGFAGVHRLIGGISTTLTDHEERLRALEGD